MNGKAVRLGRAVPAWGTCAFVLVAGCARPSSSGVFLYQGRAEPSTGGVILYQGPDRPGDEAIEGPAPPSDYNFGPVRRDIDLDGDRRRDRVEFVSKGKVIGVGDDTNHDGKIDRYQKLFNGTVIEETRDTNFDGILDLRSIDTDSDGRLDKDIQLLPPLNGQPLPPPGIKSEYKPENKADNKPSLK